MKIFVETDRFILRELLENDVQGIYALDSDPEVQKYIGNDPIKSTEQALERIKDVRAQYERNGIGRWAIIDKKSDEFIGWTGLKYEEGIRDFAYYDLGYRLRPKFWGQGIGFETALASLKYGFEELKYDKICGAAHIDNIASNKILKNVGLNCTEQFEFEGDLHNWYEVKRDDWIQLH